VHRSFRLAAFAVAAVIPLSALTACGSESESGSDSAAKSLVGNKGTDNTKLSDKDLNAAVDKAFSGLRGAKVTVKGDAYGAPVAGEVLIDAQQDIEGFLTLAGKRVDFLATADTGYVRPGPGVVAELGRISDVVSKQLEAEVEEADLSEPPMPEMPEMKARQDAMDAKYKTLMADTLVEAGKLVENKFVKVPSLQKLLEGGLQGGLEGGLEGSLQPAPDDMPDDMPEELPARGALTKINGIEVIPLIDKTDYAKSVSTLYVTAKGPVLPVRLTEDGDGDGKMDMTLDFTFVKSGKDLSPKVPAAPETVELSAVEAVFDKAFEAMSKDIEAMMPKPPELPDMPPMPSPPPGAQD
jgi:hypothetical protein